MRPLRVVVFKTSRTGTRTCSPDKLCMGRRLRGPPGAFSALCLAEAAARGWHDDRHGAKPVRCAHGRYFACLDRTFSLCAFLRTAGTLEVPMVCMVYRAFR